MHTPDLADLCRWARLPGINAPRLLAAHAAGIRSVADARHAPASLWRELGWPISTQKALSTPDNQSIENDLASIEEHALQLIAADDDRYPSLLRAIDHAPAVLFVRGDPAVLSAPQLAVIGSRHPTALGERTARDFAFHFASLGLVVTSGLALGIDAAGHRAALLAGGKTVAVCACGLDRTYPERHAELAAEIAATGALVSEFPPGTPPLASHFPRRNRLISGLSVGVLVVEAAARSGSLVTARYAAEQGREVFAIPGSIHSPLSRGCHQLLRQGATLVECADDVLSELKNISFNQWDGHPPGPSNPPSETAPRLDNPSEILLDALGFEPTSLDALIASTGLSSTSVASLLLTLELQGRAASDARGRYFRL
ncbi:MAG: DNA-processing protein DprA [Steroidobacteraceae bacterium]